jgi:hypothetical protein
MGQKRDSQRYNLKAELNGKFQNGEIFIVKDVSFSGISLLSIFSPDIGNKYKLYINNNDKVYEINIEVTRNKVVGFNSKGENVLPMGALHSIAGRILDLNGTRKKFLLSLQLSSIYDSLSLAQTIKKNQKK